MEYKVIGLYLAGHIGFLQLVKYIKHKRGVGLKEAKTYAEVMVAKYGESGWQEKWREQPNKLDFPLAYIDSPEDAANWVEEVERLVNDFLTKLAYAEGKDYSSLN